MSTSFTSKWLKNSLESRHYASDKSDESPLASHLQENSKPSMVGERAVLIARLQAGQTWLLDQHHLWQAGDASAASDEEFSRVWNRWWELDDRLRTDYGLQGCVYGADGTCPDGFPCQGCSGLPTPAVVAQLALAT